MSMATAGARESSSVTTSHRVLSLVAVVFLLAMAVWAGTAGQSGQAEVAHTSPGTVEAVEGSEFSVVTLTPAGAENIGLELARVVPASHPAGKHAVPYGALIHGADGTVWVYASAGAPLQFRRHVVEVAAVDGHRAILTSGPGVGTTVVGTGAAELYGTEFEVGH
jgi:hypothetical protein